MQTDQHNIRLLEKQGHVFIVTVQKKNIVLVQRDHMKCY